MYLHSFLISVILMGINGDLAAWRGRKRSLHKYLEIRVSGVVTRQNAARVFITGLGLPARMAKPWAVARCRARWVFSLNSYKAKEARTWYTPVCVKSEICCKLITYYLNSNKNTILHILSLTVTVKYMELILQWIHFLYLHVTRGMKSQKNTPALVDIWRANIFLI